MSAQQTPGPWERVFNTPPTGAAPAVLNAAARTKAEHAELVAMLKRTTFLLSSARLVIKNEDSRKTANAAVNEANALIKRVEGGL